MIEIMKGDKITAQFDTAYQGEVRVIGVVREFKGDMICCNEVETGKPFFCYESEILKRWVDKES